MQRSVGVLKSPMIEGLMESAALPSGNQEIYLLIKKRALELPGVCGAANTATNTLEIPLGICLL